MHDSSRDAILREYDRDSSRYHDFASGIATLTTQILLQSGIAVHSVTFRCKERESLLRKLQKTSSSYRLLVDITDIAAMRITTYFSDDVDRVAEIVEKEFEIDRINSVDKRAVLDPDRFGYQSLHYVVKIAEPRVSLPEYRRFNGLKVEIQVRSILQHAWAEIEHDLGYKSSSGVPREIRRKFARVAGLLELADAEFGSIRTQLNEYANSVVSEIEVDPSSVDLNLASLRALYKIDSYLRRLDSVIANIMGRKLVEDADEIRESYVERLADLGVLYVNQLEKIAKTKRATIESFAQYWLSLPDIELEDNDDPMPNVIESGIGLFYLLYVMHFETGDRAGAKAYFEDHMIGSTDDKDILVARLMGFQP